MKREAEHRQLRIAMRKAQFHYGRHWCAYVTPTQILLLVKAGARADAHDIARAKDRQSKGASFPTWFYFEPTDALRDLSK